MKNKVLTLFFSISFLVSQENTSRSIIGNIPFDSSINFWSIYNNEGYNLFDDKLSYKNDLSGKSVTLKVHLNNYKNTLYLEETYLLFKINNDLSLKVGRYYRDFSKYLDDDLSSGSLLISRNARPMPKLGFLGNYKIKKRKNISFNYGISHANFKKTNIYNKAPFLHEKFVYLNINRENNKYGIGFVHEAMWGGSSTIYGDFPNSFKDFLKVLISADGQKSETDSHANALGNHIGIWDFYYIKNINKNELTFYYQHIFEDTSGLRFANRFDGLWGFKYDNNQSLNFNIEYLITTNQDIDPPYINESYYNHYQYLDGWSYNNLALGNPFINFTNVNPSKVVHLGVNKKFNAQNFNLLLSRNITESDKMKYRIKYGSKINNIFFEFYLTGEKSIDSGILISYKF